MKHHKLRSLDSRVLIEVSQVRSTLHSVQRLMLTQEMNEQIERDIRSLDVLIPKLKERKRV